MMRHSSTNTLGVYAEDLGVYTSSTPSRDMIRCLIQLRKNDHFAFIFRKNSENADWAQKYLQSLPQQRISTHTLRWSRRKSNIRSLLGLSHIDSRTLPVADIFLRFDAGGLGKRGVPLIDLIADLSALDKKYCSMPWHGRILFKQSLDRTIKQSTATVAISQATAEAIKQLAPTMSNKIHLIPNGIGDEWHQAGATDASDIENYWVWYGQVTQRKNLHSLLIAYQTLLQEGHIEKIPKLRIIAQASKGRTKLQNQANAIGLNEYIDFYDPMPLPDLISQVKSSRGLLFPSYYEGFGMPIIEAMACGRPVLTSNVTSMPEVAGGFAVLCDPHAVSSIKSALERMLQPNQDTAEARELRRKHASQYTAYNAAKAYSDLIDQVLTQDERTQSKKGGELK